MNHIIPIVLLVVVAVPLCIVLLVYLIVPAAKGLGFLIRHIFRFIFSMLGDVLRIVGSILTSLVFIPITLVNVLIGRWSAAAHYGRAIEAEFKSVGACLYRLAIGHPARLLGLGAMTEGLERRIPEVVANAPGAEKPGRRTGQFDGYKIIGSLPGGGSGSRLFVAEPSPEKLAAFARAGQLGVDKVVVKSFSLLDGSSLPQIVRENRALIAAKRLGLILDDDLAADRFYYVMRYVPGESLGVTTQRLHAVSGPDGLKGKYLTEAAEYGADLLRTLHHYHSGGLWHKDVKPDNIIVAAGQAHLVDFGLITPLRSSMTLTTHGTEYFRDPEMVRMALRGVKVHEVDGAKFDIYAAGAVMYSVIENSFPAHGGLSQITKTCPEALRWIVRRAMTDYDKRYDSAATMLADVEAVLAAPDPFAVKPVDLPSVRGGELPVLPVPEYGPRNAGYAPFGDEFPLPRKAAGAAPAFAGAAAVAPAAAAASIAGYGGQAVRAARAPLFRITNWWTGRYDSDGWTPAARAAGAVGAVAPVAASIGASSRPARSPRVPGATAAEQLASARSRAGAARQRAQARMGRYRKDYPGGVNGGVIVAFVVFLALVGLVVSAIVMPRLVTRAFTHAFANFNSDSESEAEGDALANTPPVVIDLADGRRLEITPSITSASESRTQSGERRTIDDRRTHVPGAEPSLGSAGTILVLRDPIAYSKDNAPTVNAQLVSLAAAGFNLTGEQELNQPKEPAALHEQEHVLAELKSEIGVKPFLSSDAAGAVRGWLSKTPAYGMIVWFGRSDDGEQETWVLARQGLDTAVVEKAGRALHVPTIKPEASPITPASPAAPAAPNPPAAPKR